MPDFYGSRNAVDSWTTTGSVESVMTKIMATGEAYGGRIAPPEAGSVQMQFGSRSGYRFWGLLAPVSMRPIVIKLTAVQRGPNEVLVTVQGLSDRGWYLVETKWSSEKQFNRAFRRLFDAFRKRTPPIET